MNHSVKVSANGEVMLPADILKALQVKAGDSVIFVQNASGYYELRPRNHSFADTKGLIRLENPIKEADLSDWIRDARDAGYRDEDK